MSPDDRSHELSLGRPDENSDALSPAQVRRFQLWRAMADLSQAQADGRLGPEQTRLLEALADNLQRLSAQLSQLAELGQQFSELLTAERSAPVPERGRVTEPVEE